MSQCRRGYHQKTEFFSVHYFAPSRTIAYRSFHIIMSGCVCVARSLDCLLACTLESTCARFCATISVDIFYLDTILYRALTQFPKVFFCRYKQFQCVRMITRIRVYECRWLRLCFISFHLMCATTTTATPFVFIYFVAVFLFRTKKNRAKFAFI